MAPNQHAVFTDGPKEERLAMNISQNNRADKRHPPVPARGVYVQMEYQHRDSRVVAAWVAGVLFVFGLALLALAVTL